MHFPDIDKYSTKEIINKLKNNPKSVKGIKESANEAAEIFENQDLKNHEIIYAFKKAL